MCFYMDWLITVPNNIKIEETKKKRKDKKIKFNVLQSNTWHVLDTGKVGNRFPQPIKKRHQSNNKSWLIKSMALWVGAEWRCCWRMTTTTNKNQSAILPHIETHTSECNAESKSGKKRRQCNFKIKLSTVIFICVCWQCIIGRGGEKAVMIHSSIWKP